jgi:ABC-type transporter Mla MlaB component
LAALDETPPPLHRASSPAEVVVLEFDVPTPIDRADIPTLCECARALLEGAGVDRLDCDVGGVARPDAVTVDALARLQLTARRLGCHVRLRHASPELQDLLAFVGLSEAIPVGERSGLEARRQAEQREEPGGVEEEDDPGDPTA